VYSDASFQDTYEERSRGGSKLPIENNVAGDYAVRINAVRLGKNQLER